MAPTLLKVYEMKGPPSPELLKVMNSKEPESIGYYILVVGKCFFLMAICLYISKVFYNYKSQFTTVSKLFILYFVTITLMIIYELVFH